MSNLFEPPVTPGAPAFYALSEKPVRSSAFRRFFKQVRIIFTSFRLGTDAPSIISA